MNKCKGCPWYGKAYWSIICPCDNCYRNEDTNIIISPTIIHVNIPNIAKEEIKIDLVNNEFIALVEKARKNNIDLAIGEWKYESDNWDKGGKYE